jgi:hypothetical protein
MKRSLIKVLLAGLAISAPAVMAQDRATETPSGRNRTQAGQTSPGQAAIDRTTAAQKYAFIFFWKDKTPQTDKAWGILQPAMAKLADSAEVVSIQIADPAEKQVVDKYGVTRAPMPLVLAVAPCGAITKAFPKPFVENELRAAFVSPGTQRCLKALQDRKLVLLCVLNQAAQQGRMTVPQGVQDFKADQRFGRYTEVILVNANDAGEAKFLKEFQVSTHASEPMTVFLAPPGVVVGTFGGAATKETLVAKLAAAQSGCAGGSCGPGGCGPKK